MWPSKLFSESIMHLQPINAQTPATPALLDEANGVNTDRIVNIALIAIAAVAAALAATGVGLALAGMIMPMIITLATALTIGVAGGIIYATVPRFEKPAHGPDSVSYEEFMGNLSFKVIAEIEQHWSQIPDIDKHADRLGSALKACNLTDPVFTRDDLEFLTLYAVKEKKLNVFEASNILLYLSLKRDFGDIQVHMLTNEKGELDPIAEKLFRAAAYPYLIKGEQEDLLNALLSLPRHLQVFFVLPETDTNISEGRYVIHHGKIVNVEGDGKDKPPTIRQIGLKDLSPSGLPPPFFQTKIAGEAHRFEITPYLLYTFLNNLFPWKLSKMTPVLGDSPIERFENFSKRDIFIPCSLARAPDEADNAKIRNDINFTDHDYFHYWIDSANCHRDAFDEIRNLVKRFSNSHKTPKEITEDSSSKLDSFCSPYEIVCDRLVIDYAYARSEEQAKSSEFFWDSCTTLPLQVFQTHYLLLENPNLTVQELRESTKIPPQVEQLAEQIVELIAKNKTHWEKDYGITLDGITRAKGELEQILKDYATSSRANEFKARLELIKALERAKDRITSPS